MARLRFEKSSSLLDSWEGGRGERKDSTDRSMDRHLWADKHRYRQTRLPYRVRNKGRQTNWQVTRQRHREGENSPILWYIDGATIKKLKSAREF